MQFRLLGPVDVLDGDRSLGITARRERAVLLRLLLEPGRPIGPERLIDDVWGDDAPADGRTSLRVLVARLRRRLDVEDEARIITTAAGYQLRLSVEDEVDAARFEALVGRAREALAGDDPAGAAQDLRTALDLWHGPALGDLADEDWARPESVRLDEARLAALDARVEADLRCGRHADLTGELEALCDAHPLHESLWGHRMVALYRSGRQAEALRAYQDLRQVLVEEVGLEPTPALANLEAAILAGDLTGVVPPPAPPASGRAPASPRPRARVRAAGHPFVGRVDELDALAAAWQATLRGERHVVLLRGVAGAGKTCLAEQLVDRVERDGGTVLDGHFDEEMLLPYQAFVEAMRQLDPPDAAGGPTPLDRLLSEVAEPDAGPAHGHGVAELERHRLFSAVEAFVDGAASRGPVLLVLEDLHWADAPSLLLLKQIARSRVAVPLLVIGTYRSTELDDDHPLLGVLAQVHRAPNVREIEVGPLDATEVAAFVEARLGIGEHEAASVAAAVVDRTAGHALFSGALVDAMADPRLDPVSRQALDVPTTVHEFVAASVSRLSRPARAVLAVAAVCGSSARSGLVLGAVGVDVEQALDGIEECGRARLLVDGEEPDELRFAHNLVRDVVYEQLPSVRRSHLHQTVADALEQDAADGDGERSAEIVHHLTYAPRDAGNLRRRIDHARRSATASMAKLAYESAGQLLEHALDAHARLGGTAAERAELLLLSAQTMVPTGRSGAASARCREAIELATSAGDPQLAARAALVLEEASWTGYGFTRAEEADAVQAVLRAALDALPGPDDDQQRALRAELLARLPRVLHFSESPEARTAAADEAMRLAEATGEARLRGAALEGLRWALWGGDDVERLAEMSERILDEAQLAGDRALEARGQVWRYLGRLDRGDLPGVRDAVAALRALGEELPEPLALWYPEVADATLALLRGDLGEAEARSTAAFGVARRFDLGWAIESFGIQLHQIRREQGRLGELEEATLSVAAGHAGEPVWQLAAADLHLQLGRADAAAAILRDVVAAAPSLARDLTWAAAVGLAADVCIALGDEAAAEVLYPLLAPAADRIVVVGPGIVCQGSAARQAGALAGLLGDWDAAVAHLERALAVNGALDAAPWVARTHLARAGVAARRGEAPTARASLAAARELATALANPALLAECDRADAG